MKNKLAILFCAFFLVGCSTVAAGTVVFIVAKYSEVVERKTRTYKRIDKCFVKDKPGAFVLAESIIYGSPITKGYEIILNPEGSRGDPAPPHHLAYAFYVIADIINDSRAKMRMEWFKKHMEDGYSTDLERFVRRKYLKSHLTKCFSVPKKYKKHVKARDFL